MVSVAAPPHESRTAFRVRVTASLTVPAAASGSGVADDDDEGHCRDVA
jgi:hypothetical protein